MSARTRDYAGKRYDEHRGVVHVYATDGRYPALLLDLVDEQTRVEQHNTMPERADYLVIAGGSLSVQRERMAARLLSLPVVLPAAGEWLRDKIAQRTNGGNDIHLVVYRAADHDIP